MTEPDHATLDRLRAELADALAENERLSAQVAEWRAVGLAGWTEPEPPVPQDELRTLLNIIARVIVVPLRAVKRVLIRSPRARRMAIRARTRVSARTAAR